MTVSFFQFGADKKARLLAQGHSDGELWGLAVHATKQVFATASDDNTLRVWDLNSRNLISIAKLEQKGKSVAFSPDGKLIAVGHGNGSVRSF